MDQSYKGRGLYISHQTKFHIEDTKNFYYKSTIFEILYNRKTTKAINYKHLANSLCYSSALITPL